MKVYLRFTTLFLSIFLLSLFLAPTVDAQFGSRWTSPPPPPTAPQNLKAVFNPIPEVKSGWFQSSARPRIILSWQASVSSGGSPISNYHIYRGNSSGNVVYYGSTGGGNIFTYNDTNVRPGNTYFYKVRASAGSNSQLSNEASAVALDPNLPSEPQNLVATGGDRHVNLTWLVPAYSGNTPIAGYGIYRSRVAGQLGIRIRTLSGTGTSYTDDEFKYRFPGELPTSIPYYYSVIAINNYLRWPFQESKPSNVAFATPTRPAFRVAGAPVLSLGRYTRPSAIELTWLPPTDQGNPEFGSYYLYRSETSSGPWTEIAVLRRQNVYYVDYGQPNYNLIGGKTYYYTIKAYNSLGYGSQSNVVSGFFAKTPDPPALSIKKADINKIELNWRAPASDGGSPITSYKVFRSTASFDQGGAQEVAQIPPAPDGTLKNMTSLTRFSGTRVGNFLASDAGYIYAVGGGSSKVEFAKINSDNTLGSWITTASLPSSRSGSVSLAVNGYVYVLGGNDQRGFSLPVMYSRIRPDGNLDSWRQTNSPPVDFRTGSAFTAGGYIYTAGGIGSSLVYYAKINSDGSLGSWKSTTSLPEARYGHTSVFADGYVYVIGGVKSDFPFSLHQAVLYAKVNGDGTLGDWKVTGSLFVNPIYGHTSVAANGYIYVIGGFWQGFGDQKTIWYAKINPGGGGLLPNWTMNRSSSLALESSFHSSVAANGYIYTGSSKFLGNQEITGTSLKYLDSGLTPGTKYYYRVSAVNGVGQGFSNEVSELNGGVPEKPISLTAVSVPGTGKINLSWGAPGVPQVHSPPVSGGFPITGYNVYRSTKANDTKPVLIINNISPVLTSLTDYKLSPRTYYYKITTLNQAGESEFSNEASAASTAGAPTIPREVTAIRSSSGVALRWKNPEFDGGVPLTAYKIYRSTTAVNPVNPGIPALTEVKLTGGELDDWLEGSPLPSKRHDNASVVVNNHLYVVGGYGGDGDNLSTYFARFNPDGTVGSWSKTAPLFDGRYGHSLVASNGYAYAIGGSALGGNLQSTVYFAKFNADGTLGNWIATSPLPEPRGQHTSVVYNGYVYVMGGLNLNSTVYYAKIQPDGHLGQWATTTSLPSTQPPFNELAKVANHSTAVVNGYIYVIGGWNFGWRTQVYYSRIQSDGTLGNWIAATSLPEKRAQHSSVITGGYLYVIGGASGQGQIAKSVYAARINSDGSLGNWLVVKDVPVPSYDSSSVSNNEYIYTIFPYRPDPDKDFFNVIFKFYYTKPQGLSSEYIDRGILSNTDYHYRISAVNGIGESQLSDEVIAEGTPSNAVFITSNSFIGSELGGISGADAKCYERVKAAGLGGSWLAWISDDNLSPALRFIRSELPYKLLSGKVIANNWKDLTDGTLSNPINVSENGKAVENDAIWTGTDASGKGFGRNCLNWTGYTRYGEPGNGGLSSAVDSKWTTGSDFGCPHGGMGGRSSRLYCFEQADPATAPRSPRSLVVKTQMNGKASLNWQETSFDGGAPVYAYNVYRDTKPITSQTPALATIYQKTDSPAILNYNDSGLVAGSTYYYRVTAINIKGESNPSNEERVVVLAGPKNLAAVPSNQKVTLSWNPPASDGGSPITSYKIYRSGSSVQESRVDVEDTSYRGGGRLFYQKIFRNIVQSGEYNQIATVQVAVDDSNVITYTDEPGNGKTSFYKVTAVNNFGEGAFSNEASAALPITAPSTPVNLTAKGGNLRVVLNWKQESDGGASIFEYRIYRDTRPIGQGATPTYRIQGTSYVDTNVSTGVTYYYKVSAVNRTRDERWMGGSAAEERESLLSDQVTVQTFPSNRVFVTNKNYKGALETILRNVDTECQMQADAAGLGGTWKVWRSANDLPASSRLSQSDKPYQLLDNTIIARNWSDLTDGNLASPINITETGSLKTGVPVWTGTSAAGGSLNNCLGSSSVGVAGNTGFSDQRWSNNDSNYNCANEAALYCVEQDILDPPSNLTATSTITKVTLNWGAPFRGRPTGYKIYRSETNQIPKSVVLVGNVSGSALTFTDFGAYNGKTYSYQVQAISPVKESGFSNEVVVNMPEFRQTGRVELGINIDSSTVGEYEQSGTMDARYKFGSCNASMSGVGCISYSEVYLCSTKRKSSDPSDGCYAEWIYNPISVPTDKTYDVLRESSPAVEVATNVPITQTTFVDDDVEPGKTYTYIIRTPSIHSREGAVVFPTAFTDWGGVSAEGSGGVSSGECYNAFSRMQSGFNPLTSTKQYYNVLRASPHCTFGVRYRSVIPVPTLPEPTETRITVTVPSAISLTVEKEGSGRTDGKVIGRGIDCGSDCYEGGTGDTVVLIAEPPAGGRFDKWEGACSGTEPTCTLDMSVSRIVKAWFTSAAESRILSISVPSISGNGRVYSTPSGINCGLENNICTGLFNFNATSPIVLTAEKADGWLFDGWTGDCQNSTTNTCSLVMTENKTLSAKFKPQTYKIEVTPHQDGKIISEGIINCGLDCEESNLVTSRITLTAKANPGFVFDGWTDACVLAGDRDSCTITLNADKRVGASFVPLVTYLLDVNNLNKDKGYITSDPAGINCGNDCVKANITGPITLYPVLTDPLSEFAGWSGFGAPNCLNTLGPCSVTMDQNRFIEAKFAAKTFVLKVNKLGDGLGRVFGPLECDLTCQGSFSGNVSLYAVENEGSEFAGWSGCDSVNENGSCGLTMNSAKEVDALFNLKKYRLTVNKRLLGGNGTVTSQPLGIINCGTLCDNPSVSGNLILKANPDLATSKFNGWDSPACGGIGQCNITMDGDQQVTAEFVPKDVVVTTFRLTVIPEFNGGSGAITSIPAGSINCGSSGTSDCSESGLSGTITLSPVVFGTNTEFVGWQEGCNSVGADKSCTVIMNQQKEVRAAFRLRPYKLTVNKTAGGSVVSDPAGIINCPSASLSCENANVSGSVRLSVDEDNNYRFDGWSVGSGCTGIGDCVVTMDENKTIMAQFTPANVLPKYNLYIDSILGDGRVTGESYLGLGINCPAVGAGDCSEKYDQGIPVTLTARRNIGARFKKWGGACLGVVTDSCPLTMNSEKRVSVEFEDDTLIPTSYSLSVSPTNGPVNGKITGGGIGGIKCGSSVVGTQTCSKSFSGSVTLTATPASSNFEVAGWGGACQGVTGDTCSLIMDGIKTVSVTFAPKPYPLTIFPRPDNGYVTSNPSGINCGAGAPGNQVCSKSLGGSVILTPAPAQGFGPSSWSSQCDIVGQGASSCTVNMTGAKTVTVNFAPTAAAVYRLNISPRPTNGKITGSGINCGSTATVPEVCSRDLSGTVTLLVESDASSDPGEWVGCSPSGNYCTVNMTAPKTVSVNFVQKKYLLTVNTGGEKGKVTSSPAGINCGLGSTDCTEELSGTIELTSTGNVLDTDFGSWSGNCSTFPGPICTLTMDAAKTTTANFVKKNLIATLYQLKIDPAPVNGKITGSGINCGSSATGLQVCSKDLSGTVILTAEKAGGYAFKDWGGVCQPIPDNTCEITVNGTKTLTANFVPAIETYTLTIAQPQNGRIFSDSGINCGSGNTICALDLNGTVNLRAEPSSPNYKVEWTGCDSVTPQGICVVTMNNVKNVSATFVSTVKFYTLTVTVPIRGKVTSAGIIDCGLNGNDCTESFSELITLKAEPAAGFVLDAWTVGCDKITTSGDCEVMPTKDKTVEVKFKAAAEKRKLTVDVSGPGVVIGPLPITCPLDCEAFYDVNTTFKLNPYRISDSSFVGWSGCDSVSGDDSCNIKMDQDKTVRAAFTAATNSVNLKILKIGTGSVIGPNINCSPDCLASFAKGTLVILSAREEGGSTFEGWLGCDTPSGRNCQLTLINSDRDVTATFKTPLNRKNLGVDFEGDGSVKTILGSVGINCSLRSLDCDESYISGTVVILSATADSGSNFSGWTNCDIVTPEKNCQMNMISDKTVKAIFTATSKRLYVRYTGNGTVSGTGITCGVAGTDCDELYDPEVSVTLIAAAGSDSVLDSWSGCTRVPGDGSCVVIMSTTKNIAATFVKKAAVQVTETFAPGVLREFNPLRLIPKIRDFFKGGKTETKTEIKTETNRR